MTRMAQICRELPGQAKASAHHFRGVTKMIACEPDQAIP